MADSDRPAGGRLTLRDVTMSVIVELLKRGEVEMAERLLAAAVTLKGSSNV